MPTVYLNLVGQSVSGTPGTGTITLGAALPGLRALAATVDGITCNGETFDVTLIDGANASVEKDCLYNSTAGTLARGTVESSTTGSRLSLTSAATVRVVAAASRIAGWEGGGGGYEVATFADLPAAGSVTVGRVYTVLGAVCTGGVPGTQWVSNGTLWRLAGNQILYSADTIIDGVSGGTTANQIFLAVPFQIGVLSKLRRIDIRAKMIASGSDPGARSGSFRIGTAGTSADTNIGSITMNATSRQFQFASTLRWHTETEIRTPATGIFSDPDTHSTQLTTATVASASTPNVNSTVTFISMQIQQAASPASTLSLESATVLGY